MEPDHRTVEDMAASKSDFRGKSASIPGVQAASDVFVATFPSHQQTVPADRGIHEYASQQLASSSPDVRLYAFAGQQAMPNADMQSHSFAAPHRPVLPPPPPGQVMTDEQLETLRRQISVYATICQQLVEMHKAIMAQQGSGSGLWLGPSIPFDSSLHPMNHKLTSRQRWTPSQNQLHILEKLFERESGTPNKQRIKEITSELSQHGQISETNVYNWFQNRRARTKRKQQLGSSNNGESEFDTDAELPDEKKGKIEAEFSNYYLDAYQVTSVASGADTLEHPQGISDFSQRHGQQDNTTACYPGTQGRTQLVNSQVWDTSCSFSESKPDFSAFSGSQEFPGRQIIITGAESQS